MSITMDSKIRRRIFLFVTAAIFAVAALVVAFGIHVANTALTAEEHLQATIRVLDLTDQYVAEHGTWPTSWESLQYLKMRWAHEREPVKIDWLRNCVDFDFNVQLDSINTHDESAFVAIKPKPPYYSAYSTSVLQLLQTVAKHQQKKDEPAK
jgi:hypothetical protein